MAQQFLIEPLSVSNALNANVKIFFNVFQICKFFTSVKGKLVNSLVIFFLFF